MGPSADGTFKNIRKLKLILDSDNCELPTWTAATHGSVIYVSPKIGTSYNFQQDYSVNVSYPDSTCSFLVELSDTPENFYASL